MIQEDGDLIEPLKKEYLCSVQTLYVGFGNHNQTCCETVKHWPVMC